MGYEGLQVNIYLSSCRLIPYVEITWLSKAPAWTKIDDILGKLEKHYPFQKSVLSLLLNHRCTTQEHSVKVVLGAKQGLLLYL